MHTRLKRTHRRRRRTQVPALRRCSSMGLIALGVIAGIVVLMGYQPVEAQTDAAKADSQPPPQKQPEAIQPAISPSKTPAKAGAGCGGKSGGKGCAGCGGKSAAAAKPLKVAEGAKWACEKSKITQDGIWRGQPVVCDFAIRNEGSEPLTFTARGG